MTLKPTGLYAGSTQQIAPFEYEVIVACWRTGLSGNKTGTVHFRKKSCFWPREYFTEKKYSWFL